jgi:AcrR family transcriptional regulator
MNPELNKKPREGKEEAIIEAAQKRFGIYGVEKTSMREIADDVHMSKGSLYYYFPDKENLYKAVIEKEQSEFLKTLEEDLKNIIDPSDCLRKFALTRLTYFKDLLNLSRIRPEAFSEYQPLVANSFNNFREKEKKIIMRIMKRGINSGQFSIKSTYESATLFLDLLRGLRSTVLSNKKLLVIDEEEFKILSKKTKDFSDIFIKGLRFKETI